MVDPWWEWGLLPQASSGLPTPQCEDLEGQYAGTQTMTAIRKGRDFQRGCDLRSLEEILGS